MQFSFVWNANIQIEVQEAAQSRLHVCGKGLNVCATAASQTPSHSAEKLGSPLRDADRAEKGGKFKFT